MKESFANYRAAIQEEQTQAASQAAAQQQGITGEDALEQLFSGESIVKLTAPRHIRQAMIDVGHESVLAPVHMLTFVEPEQILLSEESWKDIEFEVALDSGSVYHCLPNG